MLLFGSETWFLIHQLDKAPKGFHYQAARMMAGMVPKRQRNGTWLYPPIGAALEIVVLDYIGVYIARQYNTVAQYIAACNIMDLCFAAERKPGMCLSRQWWEHPALDIMGVMLGQESVEGGAGGG